MCAEVVQRGVARLYEAFQGGDLGGPAALVGCFEHQRHGVETGVAHDPAETIPPEFALAQGGVAVDMAAAGLKRIVQVKAAMFSPAIPKTPH